MLMRALLVCLAIAALPARVHAEGDVDVRAFEYLDVIETADGSVWKGVVVEQTPNVQYKVAIAGGSVHVIKATDIVKISKQKNPEWRDAQLPVMGGGAGTGGGATPMGTGVGAKYEREGGGLPPPFAQTGLRLEPQFTLVFPTGDIDGMETSFSPSVNLGYEALFGNFGIGGGGLARFTYCQA